MNPVPRCIEPSAVRFRNPPQPPHHPQPRTLGRPCASQTSDKHATDEHDEPSTSHPPHRSLDIWQREAADRLGLARVTGQEVLTALIDQLLADPKLAAQITRSIQARR